MNFSGDKKAHPAFNRIGRSPSPSRLRRATSPRLWRGRGTQGREGRRLGDWRFLAPTKWGRGVREADGEGAALPYAITADRPSLTESEGDV
ncbi:hypothetical protein MPL1032_80177 [Mesorhizobium plurifarium]|uniref:Uncharacterized protein n=1 Tax=Mesorhizobium plurifarium TaxID=69974 RepID=A0A0K2W7C2_MESPL|nr:hypothetical protein MPL1032_80177 [Mesorhizobium plurifarium]